MSSWRRPAKTFGDWPKATLVVTMIEVRSQSTDQLEQRLTASLGEKQIAEFVEDEEVETDG
ncbi:hypothetical protein MesoLjLb_68080 [Mesorhizobium sp. L-8-3]|nr:hypothetical protein MesoLjLb_68080 [Mesorhizobium sp. L-8-3]